MQGCFYIDLHTKPPLRLRAVTAKPHPEPPSPTCNLRRAKSRPRSGTGLLLALLLLLCVVGELPLAAGKTTSGSGANSYSVQSWSTREVARWTRGLVDLPESVADAFASELQENDIDGAHLLSLDRNDIKDLGVTKLGHVKTIVAAIAELAPTKSTGADSHGMQVALESDLVEEGPGAVDPDAIANKVLEQLLEQKQATEPAPTPVQENDRAPSMVDFAWWASIVEQRDGAERAERLSRDSQERLSREAMLHTASLSGAFRHTVFVPRRHN
jgi:hypothetical protein